MQRLVNVLILLFELYPYDRAARLVTQDLDVIGPTMMKLCGGTLTLRVDYEQFLAQACGFQKNYNQKSLGRFWADIVFADSMNTFPIWRAPEILHLEDSGEFRSLEKCTESDTSTPSISHY